MSQDCLIVTDAPANALLIEDDAQDRLAIRLQLEVMGLVVYDTASAVEAAELFVHRDYSIVLIHLGHAPLESMQICRRIRASSTVPIIMLTKRGEVVDEELVLAAGADDYITKPVEARILVSRITQQLKRGETQRAPRATVLSWGWGGASGAGSCRAHFSGGWRRRSTDQHGASNSPAADGEPAEGV